MPDSGAILEHLSLLSDPLRVRILRLVEAEELAVGELSRVLQAAQSSVSRHLKALAAAGWLARRTHGVATYVAMADDLDEARAALWRLVRDDAGVAAHVAEDRARLMAVLAQRPSGSRAFFGRVAGEWDAVRDAFFGRDFRAWAPAAALSPRWTVCDLGCGTGELLARVAPFVARVVGVDQEPSMLEAARRRLDGVPTATLHLADLAALPLADAIADVCFCVLVLHHLPDPGAALAEAARVLGADGSVVVVDMVEHAREDYRATMGHAHLGFSRETLAGYAEAAGLEVATHHRLPADPDVQGPSLFVAVLRAQGRQMGHRSRSER